MTDEFEHPSEVPETDEVMIDISALAHEAEEKEKTEKKQQVAEIVNYDDFLKQAIAGNTRTPKSTEDKVEDAELGAKFLAAIEFDEEKAIERVRNKKWLIYGILPHNDVGYIYGNPGSYKSFMAMDIASRVASASKWNGIDVDYPGMVLYIAAEGGSETHLRKKAWRVRSGEDNSAVIILERAVMINDPVDREKLKGAMREVQRITGLKFVLVVIDTFSKCFVGNENDAAEMRSFITGCEDVRDSFEGCAVLFVGHTAKHNQDAMRGSSVALADCGFSYRIRRGKEKLYAEMHTDKIKDATEPEDMAFEFSVVKTGDTSAKGIELTSLVPKMTAVLERIEVDDKTPLGRAERPPEPKANTYIKAMIMSQLRIKVAGNNGEPIARFVIRDDVMHMQKAEGTNESTAKTNWRRAMNELLEEGFIEKCDGDHWLPVKGK